jgi:hypothetical protein
MRVALVVLSLLLLVPAALADEKDERIRELEARLSKLESEKQALQQRLAAAVARGDALEKLVAIHREKAEEIEKASRLLERSQKLQAEYRAYQERRKKIEEASSLRVALAARRWAKLAESLAPILVREVESGDAERERQAARIARRLDIGAVEEALLARVRDDEAPEAARLRALDLLLEALDHAEIRDLESQIVELGPWGVLGYARALVRFDDTRGVALLMKQPLIPATMEAFQRAFGDDLPEDLDPVTVWKRCRSTSFAGMQASVRALVALSRTKVSCEAKSEPAEMVATTLTMGGGVPWVCLPSAVGVSVTQPGGSKRPLGEFAMETFGSGGLRVALVDGVFLVGTEKDLRERAGPPDALLRLPPVGDLDAERVRKALAQPISVALDEIPLPELAAVLQSVAKLDLVPLPGTDDARVTGDVEGVPVGSLVKVVSALTGLRAEARWGAVLIGSPSALAEIREVAEDEVAADEASLRVAKQLSIRLLDLEEKDTPIEKAFGAFAKAGIEVAVPESLAGVRVDLRLKEALAENALRLMLRPHGLRYRIAEGVVHVLDPGDDR